MQRSQSARKPAKEEYAAYLETKHWQTVRDAALERAEQRCQLCYSPDRLQVHHRTYQRLGNERAMDLTVLCAECHQRHHGHIAKPAESTRLVLRGPSKTCTRCQKEFAEVAVNIAFDDAPVCPSCWTDEERSRLRRANSRPIQLP